MNEDFLNVTVAVILAGGSLFIIGYAFWTQGLFETAVALGGWALFMLAFYIWCKLGDYIGKRKTH